MNNSNSSINTLNNANNINNMTNISTNNIFLENDRSIYQASESSYKAANQTNNTSFGVNGSNVNLNGSNIITATLNNTAILRHANSNLPSREKTNAQMNLSQNTGAANEKASRSTATGDSTKASYKENSFYVNNNGNNSKESQQMNSRMNNANGRYNSSAQVIDTNSILNSFFANNSTISNSSHAVSQSQQQTKVRSSAKPQAQNRSSLSSKHAASNQTPTSNSTSNAHHPSSQQSKSDCLTSNEAVQLYGDKLSEFEKHEINEYAEIWYLGLEAEKLHAANVKEYDDENGAYIKVNKDHIAYRYEVIETLGKGSFGQVLKCFDHKKKEYVALKIIRSKKRFQQQGMVEVSILQHMKNMDNAENSVNVVHMKEYFYFRNHLCITFEILG